MDLRKKKKKSDIEIVGIKKMIKNKSLFYKLREWFDIIYIYIYIYIYDR